MSSINPTDAAVPSPPTHLPSAKPTSLLPPPAPLPPPPPPADATDLTLEPAEAPRRRHRGRWIAVGAAAAVLVAGGGIALAVANQSDPWPSSWDPRVERLVAFVEQKRGKPFEHPVDVQFLAEDAYVDTLQGDDRAATGDGEDADPDADADAAVLRALGWIADGVDPDEESQALLDDGTLAYYTPGEHRIVVRGQPTSDDLDVNLRVTLVHELTHAWQDQHLDLERSFDAFDGDFGFRSLSEGDAVRIEDEYLGTLSEAELDAFDAELTEGPSPDAGATPDAPGIELAFAGPYVVGPSLVATLDAIDGNGRIDEAFATPPASSEHAMFPAVFEAGIEAVEVTAPPLPEGAEAIGPASVGGSWELLTTLGGRIESADALAATRAWAGGTQQIWRETGDRVCMGWALAADGPDGLTVMQGALDDWVAAGPKDVATVERSGDIVTLVACDPAERATVGDADRLDEAMALAAAHAGLVSALTNGADVAAADCVATKLVTSVDPELLQRNDLTEEEAAEVFDQVGSLAEECRGAVVKG